MKAGGRAALPLLDTLIDGFALPHMKTTGLVVAAPTRPGRRRAVPVNAAVVEHAKRIERHEIAPRPENLALLLKLAGDDPSVAPTA